MVPIIQHELCSLNNVLVTLQGRGYLRDWVWQHSLDSDAMFLDCGLWDGTSKCYVLTALEIANGDSGFWMRTVERDIKGRRDNPAYSSMPNQNYPRQQQQNLTSYYQHAAMNSEQERMLREQFGSQFFAPIDIKADKKSEELFLMACGKEAFDTLNSGNPLPIIGSKGTKYTLHKRASYCVERVSDNAKLCAVVPGVPLWDHLLGIKLMIEHDEPKFLKTAHVARDYMRGGQTMNERMYCDYGGANIGIIGGLGAALGLQGLFT